ncbi:MAG: hypothetical protein LR011_12195 [Verrucomicrobia bacterium]|nr:hypothetical protein [Verrucomicrobiota bacterium]
MNPFPVIHDHPGIALAQMVRVGRIEGKNQWCHCVEAAGFQPGIDSPFTGEGAG